MIDTFPSHSEARIALLRRSITRNPDSADLWYGLADALADAGDDDGYVSAFERAFRLLPRMLRPLPQKGDVIRARKLRDRALILADRGYNCGAVLGPLAVSEAVLGNTSAVARLIDYGRFLRCMPSVIPPGHDADRFLAALADEIKKDLKFYGTSDNGVMRNTWRNERTLDSQAPVCQALMAEIRRRVDDYIADIAVGGDHRLMNGRPDRFSIKSWAIVAKGDGHLVSHIHSTAWLAGVYYVASPAPRHDAEKGGGQLRVGPPTDVAIPAEVDWPERFIDPVPGSLVLMPGYFFHTTQPTRSEQERICVAFNVHADGRDWAGDEAHG